MSETAWVIQLARGVSDEAVKSMEESFSVIPETFTDFEQKITEDEYSIRSYQSPEDRWRELIWKQAVIHAEYKARLGEEPRRLNWYINGIAGYMSRLIMQNGDYEGFVPEYTGCECCTTDVITNVDLPVTQLPDGSVLCETCTEEGHTENWYQYFDFHEGLRIEKLRQSKL